MSLPAGIKWTEAETAFDRDHLWHPYSSMAQPAQVWPVARAEGVRLYLEDGRVLLDGMSSWWSAIHGYQHPHLDAALQSQISQMSHVMFGGLTHQPAVELGRRLVALTPPSLDQVFIADSGSVSVEVALKMAVQYQQARGLKEKTKVAALLGGYHGDTLGAMSVCDPQQGMHRLFRAGLPEQVFVPRPSLAYGEPWQEEALAPLEQLLQNQHHQLAALILEPVVQGAGGMYFYHPEYLRQARWLCDAYDVLLIADEIATGFGRTGHLFACEMAGIEPDLMCVGKALTGGYMTLAATLTRRDIALTISQGEAGGLMHGPTFMANPLACRVACASLDLLLENDWAQQVAGLEAGLKAGLAPLVGHPAVAQVRVLGGIGVVQMHQPVEMARLQPACVEAGIWIRPFNRLIYMMPPYVMSAADLAQLTASLVQVIEQVYAPTSSAVAAAPLLR